MANPAVAAAYAEAERHFAALKASQETSGNPCATCALATMGSWSFERKCHHPFMRRGEYDEITGKVNWKYPDHSHARAWACRNGVLWRKAAIYTLAWRWAKREVWPMIFLTMGSAVLGPIAFVYAVVHATGH